MCSTTEYYETGFLSLQYALDMAIIGIRLGRNATEQIDEQSHLYLTPLPLPSWLETGTLGTLFTVRKTVGKVAALSSFRFQFVFPLLIVLSFSVTAIYTSRSVCAEKEARLIEYMRVMGLNDLIYWLSHFITSFTKMFVMMLAIAFCM